MLKLKKLNIHNLKHFATLGVAVFLATLPLTIDYNTCGMVIMAVAMVVTFVLRFIRTIKGRRCEQAVPSQKGGKFKWLQEIFTWQPIFYVLWAMYIIHFAGLLYTGDLRLGVRRLDSIVPLVLFPVLFSIVPFSRQHVILLLRFFVWTIIAFCGFALLSYATIIPGFDWNMVSDGKLYAPLLLMWPAHGHASFDSTIVLMAVPVAMYLRFTPGIKESSGMRITLVELCLGVLLPIIFTVLVGARVGMAIIPFLLGFGYIFYCKFKPLLKWSLMGLSILAIIFVMYKFPQVDNRFDDPTRTNLRAIAVNAIKEKPILGWGAGYVAPLIQSEERAHQIGLEVPYEFNQFHNQYLETVVQFGIPGALLLLLLIGWLLYLACRRKDYLLLSVLIIYLLLFWTETALATSKGIVPFVFWVSFLVARKNENREIDAIFNI
jgi:O-antigen ligase